MHRPEQSIAVSSGCACSLVIMRRHSWLFRTKPLDTIFFKLDTCSIPTRPKEREMKAMLMTAVNQPLSPRDIPDPQPGPGQVRIRLHATGVCGTDIHILHGELPVPLPIVPGHEPVGTID